MTNKVTRLLRSIEAGNPQAAEDLLPIVYEQLRQLARARLARENPGNTLQPTALVHEAYLRLVGQNGHSTWDGRAHFFASAAEAMRRILIEEARRKSRAKHGANGQRVPLENIQDAAELPAHALLELNDAIEEIARQDPEKAEVVKLRFFVGYTISETAEALGISAATVKRHWTFSRAFLFDRLRSL